MEHEQLSQILRDHAWRQGLIADIWLVVTALFLLLVVARYFKRRRG